MPPRKPLPHVERITAKGRVYWYVKIKGRRLGRLPGEPNSPEWLESYAAIMRRHQTDGAARRHAHGSVAWMIEQYKRSDGYERLSPGTQSSYARNMDRLAAIGQFPAAAVKRSHIREMRERIKGDRARHLFVQVCSRLWSFGISDLDIETTNPAAKMKREGRSVSYAPWSEDQMAAFEASDAPRAVRTAYMIARYAGPRRGDLARLRRSAYDGMALAIPGSKTDTPVTVPAHPRLKAYLDSLPATLFLVADERGRPLAPETLSKAIREHLDKIGLDGLHLHGLRHTAGTALAEAGCTPHEIAAVLGHRTLQMVQLYTKRAQQGRLAASAIVKLRKRDGT